MTELGTVLSVDSLMLPPPHESALPLLPVRVRFFTSLPVMLPFLMLLPVITRA